MMVRATRRELTTAATHPTTRCEEILVGNGRRFRVLDIVPFGEEDESPFVGLLQVGRHSGIISARGSAT
jgi:hypothetical protein